jgi:hypothetical protein
VQAKGYRTLVQIYVNQVKDVVEASPGNYISNPHCRTAPEAAMDTFEHFCAPGELANLAEEAAISKTADCIFC